MGIVDAAGIGLGGGFGGWGGALEGNFAGDAVTLFADMKEQDMAQVSTSPRMVKLRCAQLIVESQLSLRASQTPDASST